MTITRVNNFDELKAMSQEQLRKEMPKFGYDLFGTTDDLRITVTKNQIEIYDHKHGTYRSKLIRRAK